MCLRLHGRDRTTLLWHDICHGRWWEWALSSFWERYSIGGAFRLTNNNFPFARLLVVLAGFASLAAAYLGLTLEKRRDVALVAMLGGLIAVIVILMYARRAGIGPRRVSLQAPSPSRHSSSNRNASCSE